MAYEIHANVDVHLGQLVRAIAEHVTSLPSPLTNADEGRFLFLTNDLTNKSGEITTITQPKGLYQCKGQKWVYCSISNIEESGSGNVVSGVSYNESTGVLTVTKGVTALTTHQDLSGYVTKTTHDTDLDKKVDKESGKGLSANDYTTAEKEKLAGLIVNDGKLTIKAGTNSKSFTANQSGDTTITITKTDLGLGNTEDGAQKNVQSDWNETDTTKDSYIKNKPSVNNGTLTIKTGGTSKGTFTANQSGSTTVDITKTDIGLGNVTNDAQVKASEKGKPGGVATLDDLGLVPSAQLPSYVDDVVEGNGVSSFPKVGENGKIYVDISENKSYRWSGSQYVEISKSIGIGETEATAYAGNKGKALADTIAQTSPSNPTLEYNKESTIGTINGQEFKVTMPDESHYTTNIKAGAAGTNANSATTNGNTYIKVLDNTTYRSQVKIEGKNATKVTSDAAGNITIDSTDTTYDNATSEVDGLMSKEDKAKLDGLDAADYVQKTGDTMTGDLTISPTKDSATRLRLVSQTDMPSNVIFGNNKTEYWNLSSRADTHPLSLFSLNNSAASSTKVATVDHETGDFTFLQNITAKTIVKDGGKSTEFLKADGSVDSNSYGRLGYITMVGLGFEQNEIVPVNDFIDKLIDKKFESGTTLLVNWASATQGYLTNSAKDIQVMINGGTLYIGRLGRKQNTATWTTTNLLYVDMYNHLWHIQARSNNTVTQHSTITKIASISDVTNTYTNLYGTTYNNNVINRQVLSVFNSASNSGNTTIALQYLVEMPRYNNSALIGIQWDVNASDIEPTVTTAAPTITVRWLKKSSVNEITFGLRYDIYRWNSEARDTVMTAKGKGYWTVQFYLYCYFKNKGYISVATRLLSAQEGNVASTQLMPNIEQKVTMYNNSQSTDFTKYDASVIGTDRTYGQVEDTGETYALESGNVATAAQLQTARYIQGVKFDGSTNIHNIINLRSSSGTEAAYSEETNVLSYTDGSSGRDFQTSTGSVVYLRFFTDVVPTKDNWKFSLNGEEAREVIFNFPVKIVHNTIICLVRVSSYWFYAGGAQQEANKTIIWQSGNLTGQTGTITKTQHGCSQIGHVQAYINNKVCLVDLDVNGTTIKWTSNTTFTEDSKFTIKVMGLA